MKWPATYYGCDQMAMVPVVLEDRLEPGTLEYAIHHIVEYRLNLEIFTNRYDNDITGRTAMADEKHRVIAYAEAFGENEDSIHTRLMLEGAKKNYEEAGLENPLEGKQLSANIGYHSTDSLKACEESGMDAYIHDSEYRKMDPKLEGSEKYMRAVDGCKRDPRKNKNLFTAEDFKFNEEGKLICPAGIALYIRTPNFYTSRGYKGINYKSKESPKIQSFFICRL